MRYQTIILVSLVISTSTGTLLRRLIIKTASHLVALTIGFFWLLGELIPCLTFLLMIHRLLIDKRLDDEAKIKFKGLTLRAKEVVIILFIGFYSIELILLAGCLLGKDNNDCLNTLNIYRNISFHIQLYIGLIYFAKPWEWTKIDLRKSISTLCKQLISFSSHIDCTINSDSESPKSCSIDRTGRKKSATRSKRSITRKTRTRVSNRGAGSKTTRVKRPVTAATRCGSSSIKILQNARNLVRVQVFK